MFRYFVVVPLVAALSVSTAWSDELPRKLLGIWSEPASGDNKCGDETLEITKARGKNEVTGRSGDWVCSWTGARMVAGEGFTSRITGATSQFVAYSVKTQCEKVDEGKDNSGIAIIVYIPPSNTNDTTEELYIHSAADAYPGGYRRCKKRGG
jgi:hypothetical protein